MIGLPFLELMRLKLSGGMGEAGRRPSARERKKVERIKPPQAVDLKI